MAVPFGKNRSSPDGSARPGLCGTGPLRKLRVCSPAAPIKFSKQGFGATRINDIGEKAGIYPGLLYHCFGSKDEVYAAIIDMSLTRMNEAALKLEESSAPPHRKIIDALEALLKSIDKSVRMARTIMLIAQASSSESSPKEVKKIIKEKSFLPYEIMERIFREGQKEDTVYQDDAEEQALLFWVTIKGLAMHKAALGKKYRSPDPETILRLFVRKPYRRR